MADKSWGEAKEIESNWFKFDEVGKKIKGTLQSKRLQPGTAGFSDQWVYEIKCEDQTIWNVGISVTKQGTVQRANNCKMGEIVGFEFHSEGEAPKKGFHAPKFLKVYSFGMDPNYSEFEAADEVKPIPEM